MLVVFCWDMWLSIGKIITAISLLFRNRQTVAHIWCSSAHSLPFSSAISFQHGGGWTLFHLVCYIQFYMLKIKACYTNESIHLPVKGNFHLCIYLIFLEMGAGNTNLEKDNTIACNYDNFPILPTIVKSMSMIPL